MAGEALPWVVRTRTWLENSVGEQTEGPWVDHARYATQKEAEQVAATLRRWSDTWGVWAIAQYAPQT